MLGIVQMWVKSFILDKINKVKHYIRIKTHNTIVLRFWCKTDIKCLICIKPMSISQYDYFNNQEFFYFLNWYLNLSITNNFLSLELFFNEIFYCMDI